MIASIRTFAPISSTTACWTNVGVAAGLEGAARSVGLEPQGDDVVVEADDLGVLGQVDPGDPLDALDPVDDRGPQPADVDERESTGRGGRGGRHGLGVS